MNLEGRLSDPQIFIIMVLKASLMIVLGLFSLFNKIELVPHSMSNRPLKLSTKLNSYVSLFWTPDDSYFEIRFFWRISTTFDVGRDDGLGSRRSLLEVPLYEDLWVNKKFGDRSASPPGSSLIRGPDIRGGFKHVPRVRLYTPLTVRGTCGNRTRVDQVQVKRLNHYTKQVPLNHHTKQVSRSVSLDDLWIMNYSY